MTVTAPSGVTRAELAPRRAEIVRATLPLIGERIEDITREFYRRMFAAHPELIRNLFNRGNQAQGAQQRALAASIATFATHLVDPALPHPAEMLSRIAHKHVSLGVTADQYRIVYEHLFAAIAAVLGPDTVTPEVAEAWDRVYWIMADVLIDLERSLYDEAGLAAGDVFRRARVTERVDDPSGAVLLTVHPLGADFSNFRPGQYISVGVTLPDGARQLRQYSLVGAPGSAELSFAVRPAGEVSNWIAEHVRVGDLVDVTAPFGDLPTPTAGAPLVLVSAGIGVTPMLGILAHLAETAPATPVRALHADRDVRSHPLRDRQRALLERLPNATLDLWYEDPTGAAGARAGLLDLDDVDLPAGAEVYLCGGTGFVQAVRGALLGRGVPAERVHCELFTPNDWLV